jgi:hypothetical protein
MPPMIFGGKSSDEKKMVTISERTFMLMEWEIHIRRALTANLIQTAEACVQLEKSPETQLKFMADAVAEFDRMYILASNLTDAQLRKGLRQLALTGKVDENDL